MWRTGLLLAAAVAPVSLWLLRPNPAREKERLIRLATERGVFVFSPHLDQEDFALVEPFMEEAFQDARRQGKQVAFVDELGGIGTRRDSSNVYLSSAAWLAEIKKDPVGARKWFKDRMFHKREGGSLLLAGKYYVPECYRETFGQFMKALHTCLIRNRDLFKTITDEDLTWQDYVDGLEVEALQYRSRDAFRRGDPDEYERLTREAWSRSDIRSASRDRNLLLQMGRLLDATRTWSR